MFAFRQNCHPVQSVAGFFCYATPTNVHVAVPASRDCIKFSSATSLDRNPRSEVEGPTVSFSALGNRFENG